MPKKQTTKSKLGKKKQLSKGKIKLKKKKKKRSSHRTTEITFKRHPNFNAQITDILTQVGLFEKNSGNVHKFKAYSKASKALAGLNYPVASGKEASKIDGIGPKLSKKIDEILQTGKLEKLEKLKQDPRLKSIQLLAEVTGIGPSAAKKFVDEQGVKDLDDLKKIESKLNKHQKIGLKYFNEFNKRIPRDEVKLLESIVFDSLNEVDEDIIGKTCGSYRRGSESSGDIDVLVTHPNYTHENKNNSTLLPQIISNLKEKNFLTDDLSCGKLKYMGVCQLSDDLLNNNNNNNEDEKEFLHRRIDIRIIPIEDYWAGLLYFTGSDFFNTQMRMIALERGYTLNEYNITPMGETGEKGAPLPVSSEEDIFDYLDLEYKDPEERNL
eukprot:TRINITY_DN16414_c0_g1_i1.p1 TRINITY_DN16414_c0_g1~~TRINITY_DN16414_c0_g1_i1.p1  ORF type:complete len:381 (-),score=130.55 TRINITY_DN16414_c0_g1_i1:155-1297(-)